MIALQSLISIAALMFLVFVLYNSYREDVLRQELFEIRDRLFDDARAGRISFDSKAYRAARTVLNGLLRFAHRVSLARFLVALNLLKPSDLARSESMLESAMASSSGEDRELCMRYIMKANLAVATHLMRSPFFLVVLLPFASYVFARMGINLAAQVVKHLRGRFADLDRVAYSEGCA